MDFNFWGVKKKISGRTRKASYYVMNYVEYGELYRIIEGFPSFSERTARYFFKKLIRGKQAILLFFYLSKI